MALGGAPEPSTLSSSALSEREASRLDKFKHLLAGPNTDLGESCGRVPGVSPCGLGLSRLCSFLQEAESAGFERQDLLSLSAQVTCVIHQVGN